MTDKKFNDPIDVNKLFSKCMTESSTEKLTARTVATYITSPFAIHCDKFAPEAEKDEITAFEELLFQRGNDHEDQTVRDKFPNSLILSLFVMSLIVAYV